MASVTLTRMAEGGIYDQLGGGFSRYSVDDSWMIPHFEKMLYDNGQLLGAYAAAAAATGESLFARVAGETADWALRDMRAPEGGFYSSLDADSEGHEGRFYLWSRSEVRALLTESEYEVFAHRFGLDEAAELRGCMASSRRPGSGAARRPPRCSSPRAQNSSLRARCASGPRAMKKSSPPGMPS